MDEGAVRLSRRNFIECASALAATAALPARAFAKQEPAPPRLGDAHVHLFNLADLPARGFFEHAVLWNTDLDFWLIRPLWPAMLDMIGFMKDLTITAADELAGFSHDPAAPETFTKARFTIIANRRISNMARQSRIYAGAYRVVPPRPLSEAQNDLRNSYYQLAAGLALRGDPTWKNEPNETADEEVLADADVERIRRGARHLFERGCPEAPGDLGNMGAFENIRRTLQWGRMLMQSRQHHLVAYLGRIRSGELHSSTIVNLLVDYDEWLADRPAPGSGVELQVALWSRMREAYRESVDIRTFVGFDPLKDVLERSGCRGPDAPAEGTTFDRNCGHALAGRIHGFKLYPPMGFRPLGNDSGMFRGNRRALRVVRERLRQCALPQERLPELLDGALRRLYGFCSARQIPILAHAFHSNEASLCAGAHAGPSGWARVMDEPAWRLRICLGHFAETGDFARAARRLKEGRPLRPRDWPWLGTGELLARNGRSRSEVFVDIGYMAELLHEKRGQDRAVTFFSLLADYCAKYDERCEYILFGTDWIMLEREARNELYVENIRIGMAKAGWSDEWQRKLLHDNLQRFLAPRAASGQP